MKKIPTYTLQLLVVAGLAFGLACQRAQLAEYKKLANDAEVPRISGEEAKHDIDAGNAVIVDSRPEFAFKHEHIAGAINIPFGAPDEKFSELPTGKKIIVYCD